MMCGLTREQISGLEVPLGRALREREREKEIFIRIVDPSHQHMTDPCFNPDHYYFNISL